jgi:hypothetical protein
MVAFFSHYILKHSTISIRALKEKKNEKNKTHEAAAA